MPILLLLLWPFLEIYVLVQVGARFGVVNTIFALIAAAVLGVGLAKAQGRFLAQNMQSSLARGEMPTDQMVHGLLIFLGGILFLIPGFVSDVVGFMCMFPGTRHLIAMGLRRQLARRMSSGQFRVFTGGPFGATGFGMGGFRTRASTSSSQEFEQEFDSEGFQRDVSPRVIDVTPISTESRSKPNPAQDPDE